MYVRFYYFHNIYRLNSTKNYKWTAQIKANTLIKIFKREVHSISINKMYINLLLPTSLFKYYDKSIQLYFYYIIDKLIIINDYLCIVKYDISS